MPEQTRKNGRNTSACRSSQRESNERHSGRGLKRYATIVADPPWDIKAGPPNNGFRGVTGSSRALPYESMSVNQIAALRVADVAADDAPEFYAVVETVSPGEYLEMFARKNRLGWDSWGNECLSVDLPLEAA